MPRTAHAVRRSLALLFAVPCALGVLLALASGGCSSKSPRDELGGGQIFTSRDAGVDASSGGTSGLGGFDFGNGGAAGDGVSSCTPRTCEDAGSECGAASDGCGGVLLCGTCPGGTVCSEASRRCETSAVACEGAGLSCGVVRDACGVGVGCGACSAGDVCSGRTGACGACEPLSCRPNSCGTVPDGCSGSVECGECPDGQVCDPLTHQCGACIPTTCLAASAECGQRSDGCGGILECGNCPNGRSCIQNECLPPRPPAECENQGATCGAIDSSCTGARVECGNCPAGETCIDNDCYACIPKSCAELGVDCGTIGDGCGGTLSCGTCETPETCGGAGQVTFQQGFFSVARTCSRCRGTGKVVENSPHTMKFWADNASFPFKSHDKWFLTENIRWGSIPASTDLDAEVNKVNRSDIWRAAAKTLNVTPTYHVFRHLSQYVDPGAKVAQSLVDPLVTAVDLDDVADLGGPLGGESGDQHRHEPETRGLCDVGLNPAIAAGHIRTPPVQL